ncbi:MAG: hypothetical protein AAGI38_11515, partial [Bacteroidota bacterium]
MSCIRSLSLFIPGFFFLLIGSVWGQQAEHLPTGVNSMYEEREPIPSPDGSFLYFWRREHPGNTAGVKDPGDIWRAEIQADGSIQRAIRLGAPVNSPGHDFIWQVSVDKDTLWTHQLPKGDRSLGMTYTTKDTRGNWRKPRPLEITNLRYKGKYKDFFLTPQGHIMLPNVSENSFGRSDLYICFKINDTTWSLPLNIGADINTPGDEDAGFLLADGKTLFFNSDGYSLDGQHEVYMSYRLDDTWKRWSRPQPVGPPVNTPGNDFDFFVDAQEKYAYWCSDHETYGSNDIFRMPLQACEIDVFPAGDHTLCEGKKITLEAGLAIGEVTYQWQKDGADIPGATSKSYQVAEAGTYQVVRTRPGCTVTSSPQKVEFVPIPDVSVRLSGQYLCKDDEVTLRAEGEKGLTYRWSMNGMDVENGNDSVLVVRQPGTYRLLVSDGTCRAASSEYRIESLAAPIISPDAILPDRTKQPPAWQWSEEFFAGRDPELILQDLSIGPKGTSACVGVKPNGKAFIEQIITFYPNGKEKARMPGAVTTSPGKRLVDVDVYGEIVVSSSEVYLSRYSAGGKRYWVKKAPGLKVKGLDTDPQGFIYLSGTFADTVQLENRVLIPTQRGGGFLAKHAPDGKLLWVRTFSVEDSPHDFGHGLRCDEAGNVYLAGGFESIANFGAENILRSSILGQNFFLAKFLSDGTLRWARKPNTGKSKIRTADLWVGKKGEILLLLNHELFVFDKFGRKQKKVEVVGTAEPRILR